MAEENQAVVAEVAKSKKGMIAALVAILLVLAAIVGVAYAMELGPFAPAESNEPVQQTPPADDESDESTETSAPASVSLPPADAQEVMFWEQMASAVTIAELVDDKFASFTVTKVSSGTEAATVGITAAYRDGVTVNGSIVLRSYNEAWFVASMSKDGAVQATPVAGAADEAVAKAIAEGCAANQEIPAAIIDGGYKLITVDKVTKGSGTAMIDVTFSGGTATTTKGQITCISKEIGGVIHWFVTGFAKQ